MPLQRGQLQHSPGFTPDLDLFLGTPGGELQLAAPPNFASRFLDFGLAAMPARLKTLAVVVDQALTSGAAQQATVQLFAARSIYSVAGALASGPGTGAQASVPFAGGAGATSQFPTTGLDACQAVGPAVNLGGSTASLAVGIYWFTSTGGGPGTGNPNASPPTSMIELLQWYPVLGVEITAPATFTGGAVRVFFEFSPGT